MEESIMGLEFELRTIDYQLMRYKTCGDYWNTDDGVVHFRVARLGNWRYEALVAVHEISEFLLVRAAGIRIEDIDAWDMAHLDSAEPGAEKDAPYHAQHLAAEGIERIIAALLGVNWRSYEDAIEAACQSS